MSISTCPPSLTDVISDIAGLLVSHDGVDEHVVIKQVGARLGDAVRARAVAIRTLDNEGADYWCSDWSSPGESLTYVDITGADALPSDTVVVGPHDAASIAGYSHDSSRDPGRWSRWLGLDSTVRPQIFSPLQQGKEPVGLLGVALDDSEMVSPAIVSLVDTVAGLIAQFRRRVHAERQVARQIALTGLLRKTAELLVATPAKDAESAVQEALARVGEALGAYSLSSWRFDETKTQVTGTAQWQHERFRSLNPDGHHMDLSFMDLAAMPLPDTDVRELAPAVVAAAIGQGIILEDVTLPCRWWAVPMIVNDDRVGILVAATAIDRVFADWEAAGLRSFALLVPAFQQRCRVEEQLGAAFHQSPSGIVLRSADGQLLDCNEAYLRFLGAADTQQLVGSSLADVVDVAHIEAPSLSLLDPSETMREVEVPFRHCDGHIVWGRVSSQPIRNRLGAGVLMHVEDITLRRAERKDLHHQAHFDALTGLPNRHGFADVVARSDRRATRYSMLALIDLNGFKKVNDRYGHHVGDAVLKEVGERLRSSVRQSDFVCRFGGDEFVVLFGGPLGGVDPRRMADHLHEPFTSPIDAAGHEINASLSVGVTLIVDDVASDHVAALARADEAMYRAKAGPAGSTEYQHIPAAASR